MNIKIVTCVVLGIMYIISVIIKETKFKSDETKSTVLTVLWSTYLIIAVTAWVYVKWG